MCACTLGWQEPKMGQAGLSPGAPRKDGVMWDDVGRYPLSRADPCLPQVHVSGVLTPSTQNVASFGNGAVAGKRLS